MLDAQSCKDGCKQIARLHFTIDNGLTIIVRLAKQSSTADSTAAQRATPCASEVIASEASIDVRRATKFTER